MESSLGLSVVNTGSVYKKAMALLREGSRDQLRDYVVAAVHVQAAHESNMCKTRFTKKQREEAVEYALDRFIISFEER